MIFSKRQLTATWQGRISQLSIFLAVTENGCYHMLRLSWSLNTINQLIFLIFAGNTHLLMPSPSKSACSSKSSDPKIKLRNNVPRPLTQFPSILHLRSGENFVIPSQLRQTPKNPISRHVCHRRWEISEMISLMPEPRLFKRQPFLNLPLHLA